MSYIEVDVGGTIFKTTQETVANCPYFRNQLAFDKEALTPSPGNVRRLFLDRDAKCFLYVLKYLRNARWCLCDTDATDKGFVQEMLCECDYLGLDRESLLAELKTDLIALWGHRERATGGEPPRHSLFVDCSAELADLLIAEGLADSQEPKAMKQFDKEIGTVRCDVGSNTSSVRSIVVFLQDQGYEIAGQADGPVLMHSHNRGQKVGGTWQLLFQKRGCG